MAMAEAPKIRTTGRCALAAGALAVALALGCHPSRTLVTHVWQTSLPRTTPMKSMIVFGGLADEAGRRALEDRFATELARHDVRALRSYELFPRTPPSPENARARLKDLALDGILVASLKGATPRTTYAPGPGGGFWTAYEGPRWSEPRYLSTDATVTFETTLWDANADDTLLWTISTRTTNPASGRGFEESLVKTVSAELEGAHWIPPAGTVPRGD
jgi:hypothetical protein